MLLIRNKRFLLVLVLFVFIAILLAFTRKGADEFNQKANITTRRFGECPTCDVTGITQNATLFRNFTNNNQWGPSIAYNANSETLRLVGGESTNYWNDNRAYTIMKFDLGSLSGKKITRAKLKLGVESVTARPEDSVQKGDSFALVVKINEGADWDDGDGVSYNYRNTELKTKWSDDSGLGDIESVINSSDAKNIIGKLYFKDWLTESNSSIQTRDESVNSSSAYLDLATVQRWADNPNSNDGFAIIPTPGDKVLASKNYDDLCKFMTTDNSGLNKYKERITGCSNLRPYIEISFEDSPDAVLAEAPQQPKNVQSHYHKGQTFITWDEVEARKDDTAYRIYRSNSPILDLSQAELIDQVFQGSSWIREKQSTLKPVQPDYRKAGFVLNNNTGLYVRSIKNGTASAPLTSYYAVTTVVEGNENLYISENCTGKTSEYFDYPDMFFSPNSSFSNRRPLGVMWLGDVNWNDKSDQFGFNNRKSAPYLFTLVFPDKALPFYDVDKFPIIKRLFFDLANQELKSAEKFPLTMVFHPSGHSMYVSQYTTRCAADKRDGVNYGGFCIGFDDIWSEVLRVNDDFDYGSFSSQYYLNGTEGEAYYAGWNSNYSQTKGLMATGCIKKAYSYVKSDGSAGTDYSCIRYSKRPDNLEIEKPFSQGRSIMYSDKSISFVVDTLINRSPWSKNFDKERVYATGGSLGGGGSLAFSLHNPNLITAVDTYIGRTKMTDTGKDAYRSPAYFGSLTENIRTQDGVGGPAGVGIYDYMNMGKYVSDHKEIDFPLIQTLIGKKDTTVPWSKNFDFYEAAKASRIGFKNFFSQDNHLGDEGFNSITFPDYTTVYKEDEKNAVYKQSTPFWNVFHFRHNQSYPAFTNFSHNDITGSADLSAYGDIRGGINRFQTWDTKTIVDEMDNYSIDLSLLDLSKYSNVNLPHGDVNGYETTDVTLRRLQKLVRQPGRIYEWRNLDLTTGNVIQSGKATVDLSGLITIGGLKLSKNTSKLVLNYVKPVLPEISPISDIQTTVNKETSVTASVVGGVSFRWYKLSGPGVVTFKPNNSFSSIITANVRGKYLLKFMAANEWGQSEKTVNFIVN